MELGVARQWKIPPWLAFVLLVMAGVAIFWPALTTPFFLDDYLHEAMVQGRFPGVRGPMSLYDFVANDNRQALFDRGFLPWWTDPRLTLRFFRPLSSALLYFEHAHISAHPLWMHLHSFGWWLVAVLGARSLFRRLVTPRAADFATVIFALAPCHALPIGWLANREALISLACGAWALSALVRFMRGDGARYAVVASVIFAVALFAGEYALSCLAFVFTLAFTTDGRRRYLAPLAFALPTALYFGLRAHYGYGAEASGFYQDPLHDTSLFLSDAPWRFVFLVLAAFFSQDADAWEWGGTRWLAVIATFVCVFGWRIALRHIVSGLEPQRRRTVYALTWGALLSLVPMLAVLPSVRLLGVAMLGVAPVVGVVLEAAWFDRETEATHGKDEWVAVVAMLLGFAHLVHGPGRGWTNARQIKTYAVEFAERTSELADRLRDKPEADIVVVRGLDDIFFYGFALEGLGVKPTHWTVLSHAGHVLFRRTEPDQMELLVGADTALYPASLGDLYRSEDHPLRSGDAFVEGGLAAEVTEMDPYGPRKARFTFDRDLDDPTLTWVGESRTRGFYDVVPPKVGFGAPFEP